jgi:Cd2+/Zn2+-exporting ATPase
MNQKWKIAALVICTTLATTAWLSSTFQILNQTTTYLLELSSAILALSFIAYSAAKSLLNRTIGIDLLATIAIVASIIGGENLPATVIALMLFGGEILENYAQHRATNAIQKLIESSPQTATVIRNGIETEVKAEDVQQGETVIVKPGGKIPVDGTIQKGHATINQSSVTGESTPVEKAEGDKVYSGTILTLGALHITATAVGKESTYGRIVTMVEEAEQRRAPIERTADKYARYFTPIIILAGIAIFFATGDIRRVASVFVIACPCALTLATPAAIVASIGNAARKGILIRNGASLEKLNKVDTLVFDKTGTITTGKPEVVEVKAFGNHSQTEVLQQAAMAEKCSEHPLAQAILAKAEKEQVDPVDPKCFQVHSGMGVRIENGSAPVTVGNEKLLKQYKIPLTTEAQAYLNQYQQTRTVIFVAQNSTVIGGLSLSDTARNNAKQAITETKLNGINKTVMVTGDNHHVAEALGKTVGVDEVYSEMMPAEKATHINKLKQQGHTVAMIGDGINDAPALAEADVGIAMGLSGTDVAIETAGITLATDDLKRVPELLRIGKTTIQVIKQNIAFAMTVNLVGIALSIGGIISPMTAAIIHESNAILVMLNSLRLLKTR